MKFEEYCRLIYSIYLFINCFIGVYSNQYFCFTNILLNQIEILTGLLVLSSIVLGGVDARLTNYVRGNLRVTVIKAYNMPDTDGPGKADPYAKVRARKYNYGNVHEKRTRSIGGNLNPVWNEELDFGEGPWMDFNIQIWDDDTGMRNRDDPMTSDFTIHILTPCSDGIVKINNQIEYSYYVEFTV